MIAFSRFCGLLKKPPISGRAIAAIEPTIGIAERRGLATFNSFETFEIMLPAIKEIVREVDVRHRRIVVAPTPGLLPEEQEPVV